ncbi:MAG: hypothetical protein ACIARR_11360 [Phycisphaerales bacterium JB059]
MSSAVTPYRTMPDVGGERWRVRRDQGEARGWVDRPAGVGRIERAAGLDEVALLGELGRRYPGVRWFRDRLA